MKSIADFFVIVIAGPTGAGKTTLSKMLREHYGCTYISEDELSREIFPNTYKNIEEFPDAVKTIESRLLEKTKELCGRGDSAVIDRINLGREFIEEIKKAFEKHLILKVLWPSMETTIERDKRREGWTSGEDTIIRFYKEYEALKPIIGERNYIDNSDQTPGETFEKLLAEMDRLDLKSDRT